MLKGHMVDFDMKYYTQSLLLLRILHQYCRVYCKVVAEVPVCGNPLKWLQDYQTVVRINSPPKHTVDCECFF